MAFQIEKRKINCRVFTFPTKPIISLLGAVFCRERHKNVIKYKPIVLCRSRYRRRRGCLSSLYVNQGFIYDIKLQACCREIELRDMKLLWLNYISLKSDRPNCEASQTVLSES